MKEEDLKFVNDFYKTIVLNFINDLDLDEESLLEIRQNINEILNKKKRVI